ncbi:MAG: hypothetical protein LBS63_04455, partial [Prevotellaceae bacterium]|nr:hypothetical protein [Prevotellaceae bacterium]
MKTWKIFFTAGLAILTAAAVISCDKAGDDWQPTWAVPLVKKQMLTIADFMDTTTVRQFNDQVRVEWNSYVDDKFGLGDSTSVDAAAFAAIASMNEDSSAYAYIAFEGNTPQLNDSTRQLVADRLTEQGVSEDSIQKRIEEVNNFLELYWKVTHPQLPQPPAGGANVLSLKGAPSRHVAAKSSDPASGSYTGGGGALNHLLDAMIHPTDVFVTAANVLSVMGDDYLAKVCDQLDEVLKQATVNNYTAVSFKEM